MRSRGAGNGISYAVAAESGIAPGNPVVEEFDGTKTAKKPPPNPPCRMRGRSMCPCGTLKKSAGLAGLGQIDTLQGIIVPVENGQSIVDCHGYTSLGLRMTKDGIASLCFLYELK